MTNGELFQRAKERVSELNYAADTMPKDSVEQREAIARYEEAKVFLELIADTLTTEIAERYDPNRC